MKYLIKLSIKIIVFTIIINTILLTCFGLLREGTEGLPALKLLLLLSNVQMIFTTLTILPIFLNLIQKIRNNKYYRFMTFYLLPILILIKECYPFDDGSGILMELFLHISFFISITIFYIKYSRDFRKV